MKHKHFFFIFSKMFEQAHCVLHFTAAAPTPTATTVSSATGAPVVSAADRQPSRDDHRLELGSKFVKLAHRDGSMER